MSTRSSRLSLWIQASIPALVFVAFLVAAVRWADSPNIRYQQFPRAYEIIYGTQGSVDVAATGSSRLASMVDAHLLAERLAETETSKVVVVDLGHPFSDIGFDYLILRDLLDNHDVNTLVVDFSVSAAHPQFFRIGRVADIIESNMAQAGWSVWRGTHLAARDLARKFSALGVALVQGRIRNLAPRSPAGTRTTDSPLGGFFVYPTLLAELQIERGSRWLEEPELKMDVEAPEFVRFTHFWDKLANLARDRGVELIITSTTRIYTPPVDRAFMAELEQRFDATVVQMGRDELAALYATGYIEPFHANEIGRRMWSEWLAGVLITHPEVSF